MSRRDNPALKIADHTSDHVISGLETVGPSSVSSSARTSRSLVLEQNGVTVMPAEARRSVDLFGTAALVKTDLGYALLSPLTWRLEQVAEMES